MNSKVNTSEPDIGESELAIAGLYLLKNQCRGDAPELHELEDWQEGRLSDARSAEIMSFVANDPEYFQLWSDICEASSYAAEEDSQLSPQGIEGVEGSVANSTYQGRAVAGSNSAGWLGGWWDRLRESFTMPQMAGAMAAVLGAFIAIPLFMSTGPGSSGGPGSELSVEAQFEQNFQRYLDTDAGFDVMAPVAIATKSLSAVLGDAVVQQEDRYNSRFGMKKTAEQLLAQHSSATKQPSAQLQQEWQSWIDTLPAEALACTNQADSEACLKNANVFQAAGSWALLTQVQCSQAGVALSNFHDTDQALYNAIKQSTAIQSSDVLSPGFSLSTPATLESLCTQATILIENLR